LAYFGSGRKEKQAKGYRSRIAMGRKARGIANSVARASRAGHIPARADATAVRCATLFPRIARPSIEEQIRDDFAAGPTKLA
jgi:hypothetical protein